MAMTAPYLSAHEIREIAGKTAATQLPIETATMLPVPLKKAGGLEALVVYYTETGPRTNRTVHPPHYAMRLDAATGKVLHFGATTPERLGIPQPLVPVPGAHIDPKMTGLEYADARDRLLDISRDVWTAFEAGSTSPDAQTTALAREYLDLFLKITKPEVAPFYTGAAPEFFAWLRAVTGTP